MSVAIIARVTLSRG